MALEEVPHLLDGIELTTLRRKELMYKPSVIELLLHDLAVVDREVVHDHDTLVKGVDLL